MKYLKYIFLVIFIFLMSINITFAKSFYPASALTGGGTGALDKISQSGLSDGDVAIVVLENDGTYGNATMIYAYDATSTQAEDAPRYIRPDDYGSAGVWELADGYYNAIVVPANSTAAQYQDYYEDTDDGSNYHRIQGQAFSSNRLSLLPDYNIGFLSSDQVDSGGDLADGSVDPVHLSDSDFGPFTMSSGVGSMDANSIDSDNYVDGSIDPEHLAAAGNFTSLTGNWATSGNLNGLTPAVSIGNCEGAHDGAGDAATLSDSGESLTVDAYIGMQLYNITDGSSCTVTDNDATTITCTLAGGTDNDWDASDVWQVGPGPRQSGSVFYITAATTIAHPATAGYVAGYFAAAAQIITIDPYSVSMTINFSDDGVFTDPGAGDEIDGDGTQGDFIWVHNASATEAYSHGVNGSWADGGAS